MFANNLAFETVGHAFSNLLEDDENKSARYLHDTGKPQKPEHDVTSENKN